MKCQVQQKCGACEYLEMDYALQLQQKDERVKQLFSQFKPQQLLPIIGMETPSHYRHKNQVVVKNLKGKWTYGHYAKNSHTLVPASECYIHHEQANLIFKSLMILCKKFKLEPYDEDLQTGLVRYFFVRVGYVTKEILVSIVINRDLFPARKAFVSELLKLHPNITTLVLNINGKSNSMVLSDQERVIYGPGFIYDKLGGLTFKLSLNSFYQINPVQTEKLYQTAIEFAQLQPTDQVLDAYCGIGTIGLLAAKHVKQVMGIELNPTAINDAKINAKLNNVTNINFQVSDAGKYMKTQPKAFDVIFIDPPRSGCTPELLEAMIKNNPQRIIYVSCDINTQARDLVTLVKAGYQLIKVQAVDMFPHTNHVESVTLLSRKG